MNDFIIAIRLQSCSISLQQGGGGSVPKLPCGDAPHRVLTQHKQSGFVCFSHVLEHRLFNNWTKRTSDVACGLEANWPNVSCNFKQISTKNKQPSVQTWIMFAEKCDLGEIQPKPLN